jgi:hypothetical protein
MITVNVALLPEGGVSVDVKRDIQILTCTWEGRHQL